MCGGRDFCRRKCVNVLSVVCVEDWPGFLSRLSVCLFVFCIWHCSEWKKVTPTAQAFPDKSNLWAVTALDGDENSEMHEGGLFMSISLSQTKGKSSESEEGKWH